MVTQYIDLKLYRLLFVKLQVNDFIRENSKEWDVEMLKWGAFISIILKSKLSL